MFSFRLTRLAAASAAAFLLAACGNGSGSYTPAGQLKTEDALGIHTQYAYDAARNVISESRTGGGLTKSGAGALTLTAANSYSGGTIINAGSLVVASLSGSATGLGAVTVAAGATLAGSGTMAGTVNLSGTISPGASPGTLATASQNWNGGGHYLWQVNNATNAPGADPGWDLLNITGGLNITAAATNRFTIDVTSLASTNRSSDDGARRRARRP